MVSSGHVVEPRGTTSADIGKVLNKRGSNRDWPRDTGIDADPRFSRESITNYLT
jgi:hypothetical protein